jgi:hypothetical protein
MVDMASLEQAVAKLQLESFMLQWVCGYLLAQEARNHPDPKARLTIATAELMGMADRAAAETGGKTTPITEAIDRICGMAEAAVTGHK